MWYTRESEIAIVTSFKGSEVDLSSLCSALPNRCNPTHHPAKLGPKSTPPTDVRTPWNVPTPPEKRWCEWIVCFGEHWNSFFSCWIDAVPHCKRHTTHVQTVFCNCDNYTIQKQICELINLKHIHKVQRTCLMLFLLLNTDNNRVLVWALDPMLVWKNKIGDTVHQGLKLCLKVIALLFDRNIKLHWCSPSKIRSRCSLSGQPPEFPPPV